MPAVVARAAVVDDDKVLLPDGAGVVLFVYEGDADMFNVYMAFVTETTPMIKGTPTNSSNRRLK